MASQRTGQHLRPAISLIPIALSSLTAMNPAVAKSESSCSLHFASPNPVIPASPEGADLTELNDPSREYVNRLNYLVRDRHLLEPQILTTLAASATPLNPLADSKSSVSLLPHSTAFVQLLKEDLQWEQIRLVLAKMLDSANQDQARAETAKAETQKVFQPVGLLKFAMPIARAVTTRQGQIVGVSTESVGGANSTTVSATDLLTGKPISRTVYSELFPDDGMDVREIAGTVIASFSNQIDQRLLSFDLLKGKLLSQPMVTDGHMTRTHIIEKGGQARVVVFADGAVVPVEPFSGSVDVGVDFAEETRARVYSSGVFGNLVFFTDNRDSSYLYDPNGRPSLKWKYSFTTLSLFAFQGKTYGFGVVKENDDVINTEPELTTFDVTTDKEIASVKVKTKLDSSPEFIDQFEQDGRVYGIVHTGSDVYVIDLVKGATKTKLSKTPLGPQVLAGFTDLKHGHMVFSYQGRNYLPAIMKGKNAAQPSKIVILDAMTLLPATAEVALDDEPVSLEVPAPRGNEIFALVNFKNGTSQVFSLLSDFRSEPQP